nr:uncharacterized protein LOC26530883 isoform X1 [Drosophila virilis]
MKVLTAVLLTCVSVMLIVVASLALLHSVYGTPVPTPIPANITETKAPPNDEPLLLETPTANPSLQLPQNTLMAANDPDVAARSSFKPISVPLSANAETSAVATAAGEQISLQGNLDELVPDEAAEPSTA